MKKAATTKATTEQKPNQLTISHNTFVGVQFDAAAVNAITRIADGLVANAEGLKQLAWVLRASNVNIEAMIKAEVPKD